MSTAEVVYVVGPAVLALIICSLPGLAALGGGPRYRAATVRYLLIGWAASAFVCGWLALGYVALTARVGWWGTYRDLTLVLMGAYGPLLFLFVRGGNRALAAARAADCEPTA